MGVSIREVIEAGGYDLSTPEDANWLLSKQSEFEELVEQAEAVVEDEYHSRFDEEHYRNCQDCYENHLDFMDEQRDEARLDAMIENN